MKYLKFISENTIKKLIEEKCNLKVEKITKNENSCFFELKSSDYTPKLKYELTDFEARCLNETLNTSLTKNLTNLFRELFSKYFQDKYKTDLNNYLNTKENKFIKNLRNYQIEDIFTGYKVLSIKRLTNAIEVVATKGLEKDFLSCYITNFKIVDVLGKNKKEIRKLEKKYLTFMVSAHGQRYIEALILNENKKTEDIKKC